MLFNEKLTTNKRQFIHAVFVPTIISLMLILSFLLEKGMGWDFHKAGILPRSPHYLTGVFTYVFVHADIGHLLNNVISFWVLAVCLHYFYRQISLKILFISYLMSGILLWTIGRESWHIGASGLVYALAFFLFFSGIIRKHVPLIAISLIITFLYGSMVWHIMPWKVNDPISWEGHLAGGITGLILSVIYRKSGPQRPIKVWDEEDENEVLYFLDEEENNEDNDQDINFRN